MSARNVTNHTNLKTETAKFKTARPTMTINVWPVNVDTSWLPKESVKECKLDVSDTKEDSALTAFPTSDSREMTVKLKDALI